MSIGRANKLPVTLCEWQPNLGIVTLYRGDAIEARKLLEEALRLCLEMKNTGEIAFRMISPTRIRTYNC